MLGKINALVLAGFELARCRMSRRGFEAFARANSQSLKIEIKQCVFAVPYRRVLGGRDDAPLPLRLDELRKFERPVDGPMTSRIASSAALDRDAYTTSRRIRTRMATRRA